MRAVVQRVTSARVEVEAQVVGSIERGLLVYLGVGKDDSIREAEWMVQKLITLRLFEDDAGKMNRSVDEAGRALLVVSQFTLFGDVRKGRRPSFDAAAAPEQAQTLYEAVCSGLVRAGMNVQTGRFRAEMQVHAQVDGPVTILVDSERTF